MSADHRPEWPLRAAEIRAALPALLFGGEPPARPQPAYRVLAEGEAAFRCLDERLAELDRLYPAEQTKPWYSLLRYQHPRRADWTTQIIEYAGWPGHPLVRAVLRIPKIPKPTAAVLCLHGHSKGLQLGCAEMAYLAEPLTAAGFVTLAPDDVPFGDRRLHVRDDWEAESGGNCFVDERALASECWLLGQTLLGRQVWELMCAVDVLSTLPQVDAARIGSIGCSQGGVHTWWLATLDPRLAAVVVSAGISTYRDWIAHRTICALPNYIPGILNLADQDELVALIAPRPLLLLNCAKDVYFPLAGIQAVVRLVGNVYDRLGATRNFGHDLDPSEHGFPERQQKLAFDWLQRHLRSVST
jgi:dienelactone hydrolase